MQLKFREPIKAYPHAIENEGKEYASIEDLFNAPKDDTEVYTVVFKDGPDRERRQSERCPHDSGTTCGSYCYCTSSYYKKTVRSSSGTCYTCASRGSESCPDDSGTKCSSSSSCVCSSSQYRKTVSGSSGTCYTCASKYCTRSAGECTTYTSCSCQYSGYARLRWTGSRGGTCYNCQHGGSGQDCSSDSHCDTG